MKYFTSESNEGKINKILPFLYGIWRISQFRLATFQLLSSHEWLTATLLDSQV